MGNKKKNGNKPHPTKSFEQYVADATLQKLGGYINSQIQAVGRAMAQYQVQQLAVLTLRLKAIETVLQDKLGVSATDLAEMVASYEDEAEGFVEVTEGGVQLGDRVRLELCHKKTEEPEFSKPARLFINNAGTGNTLGKDLEEALLGVPKGETREVMYGKDYVMTARLTVNRISRPKPTEVQAETAPAESAPVEGPTADAPSTEEQQAV